MDIIILSYQEYWLEVSRKLKEHKINTRYICKTHRGEMHAKGEQNLFCPIKSTIFRAF